MLTPGPTSSLPSLSSSSCSLFNSQHKHRHNPHQQYKPPPRHKNNNKNNHSSSSSSSSILSQQTDVLSEKEWPIVLLPSSMLKQQPPVLDYFWSGEEEFRRTCCPAGFGEKEDGHDDTTQSNNNSPKRRRALIITNSCDVALGESKLAISSSSSSSDEKMEEDEDDDDDGSVVGSFFCSTKKTIIISTCLGGGSSVVRKRRRVARESQSNNNNNNSKSNNSKRKSNDEKDDDDDDYNNCLILHHHQHQNHFGADDFHKSQHGHQNRHEMENEAAAFFSSSALVAVAEHPRGNGYYGRVDLLVHQQHQQQCSELSSSSPPFSSFSTSTSTSSTLPSLPLRTRQGYLPSLFPLKRKLPWRNPQKSCNSHHHRHHHHHYHHHHHHHHHHHNNHHSSSTSSSSSHSSSHASCSSPFSSATIQVYFYISLVLLSLAYPTCHGNPDAKRLYDDLLSNYNRLIRPVSNNTETVLVRLGLRLSQLIDLNLKDQILTTNVWLEHEWEDHKFKWDPHEYGGVTELYVPSENIWLPDIVLYNNADGEYVVTTMTKAVLHSNGKVTWTPPAIFKSSCEIDVRYFPFDMQTCFMKFGSWTYDGFQIDLKHINQEPGKDMVTIGIDLREYYPSVEWDILSVPAERHEKFYPCCLEPYPDIFFNITLRRRTLFYTVNLIIPTVGISYLSILVFYLPADSGEKVALCISILLSQTMFFLLISEIIPSTSLAVPLLGKYLLFTMFLVGLSVLVTTIVLNVHYRKPSTHKMAPWVRQVFTRILPKFLLMRVPDHVLNYSTQGPRASPTGSREDGCNGFQGVSRLSGLSLQGFSGFLEQGALEGFPGPASTSYGLNGPDPDNPRKKYPFEIQKAIHNVKFIQTHMQRQDEFDSEDQDWGFVAMVLDRIFLMLFNTAFFVGTVMILLDAPALYDYSEAIDKVISTIAKAQSSPDIDI